MANKERTVECLADVKKWIADIEAVIDDDESAHIEEDSLYRAVLKYIADGGKQQAREMAYEALGTQELEFARWCA